MQAGLGDEPRRVQAVEAARQRRAVARLLVAAGRPVLQPRAGRQPVRQPVRDGEAAAALQLRQHDYHLPALQTFHSLYILDHTYVAPIPNY